MLVAGVVGLLVVGLASVGDCASWEQLGPDGGTFLLSVADPANVNNVTAITSYPSRAMALNTSNGGGSWVEAAEIPYYYLQDCAAFDYSRLFATSRYGCYYSTDGGENWLYGRYSQPSVYANCICVHPTDPSRVYAAGYLYQSGSQTPYSLALFNSIDGGANWSVSSFSPLPYVWPYDIAISRTNPDVLYIAGIKADASSIYYGAAFKSTDGGENWTDISEIVTAVRSRYFYSVAIDPTNVNNVYLGGPNYFYRSTDGGASWANTGVNMHVSAMAIDSGNPSTVYGAGYDDVYKSVNYGQTWTTKENVMNGRARCIHVAQAGSSTVYLATEAGFYRSADSGETWHVAHDGVQAARIPALAVAPSEPTTIYVEHDGGSLASPCVSNDSGLSWVDRPPLSECGGIIDFLVDPDDPEIVLALEYG